MNMNTTYYYLQTQQPPSMDNTTQYNHQLSYKDPDDPERVTSETRKLGLVVIRGTQVSLVSPEEGTEEIANPFLGGDEEE